jgi:hypothetical protein
VPAFYTLIVVGARRRDDLSQSSFDETADSIAEEITDYKEAYEK